MKRHIPLILFVLITNVAFSQKKEFKIFNSIQYLHTPDLTQFGFHKINIIYEAELLSNSHSKNIKGQLLKEIDTLKFINVAKKVKQEPSVPVCLDIESWKLNNETLKGKSTPKYLSSLQLFRSLVPGMSVEYFFYYFNPDSILYPSFYTSNNNREEWKRDVEIRIGILRKKYPDKKIYAFIWPQYNPLKKWGLDLKFLPADYWRFELETLYKFADGIVIWTQYQPNKKDPITFSEKMPWFQQTLEFIKKYNIN